MRQLIKDGFLTEYRIFAPPSNLDLTPVTLSAGGDYNPPQLRKAVHASCITGDVVQHYLNIAPETRRYFRRRYRIRYRNRRRFPTSGSSRK